MVRSLVTLPSLFGLFQALLILSPEGLLGGLTPTRLNDPEMRLPLRLAVEQLNLEAHHHPNYYKAVGLKTSKYQAFPWTKYLLEVRLVETTCQKKVHKLYYNRIQECEQLPGNDEEANCFFTIKKRVSPIFDIQLDDLGCD